MHESNVKPLREKIGFIGGGNMAKAICEGIVRKGLIKYSQVYVSGPHRENLIMWKEKGANTFIENGLVVEEADIIFLAVKPHILPTAIVNMFDTLPQKPLRSKLFVSILAGIPMQQLENVLCRLEGCRLIRVMPNTPMMVGEGCTVFSPGARATEHDIEIVKSILSVSGVCRQVPESLINAVGALSGSGPAFVYLMIEALADGGVKMGIPRAMAVEFATQTVLGAAKMVKETGKHTGELRDEVTSPGGTTITGLHALERGGVRCGLKSIAHSFCTAACPTKIPQKIGFIGDGSMAKAICKGIKRKGLIQYSQVYVSSPYINNLESWKELGANISTDNSIVAKEADLVFLAVKPHFLQEAVAQITTSPHARDIKNKLFISILAGMTIKDLEELLSPFEGSRVVRVMPNTPVLIGEGCTVYTTGTTVTDKDKELIKSLLDVTGMCEPVPEHMINAVGALSASGPAFVYVFIEALSDGGVRMGLHRDMATKFAAQTVMGSAKMVLKTNKHMGTLKDEVCSAGGQTIAGIHAMERGAARGAIMDAIEAAALKAFELGKQCTAK